MIVGVEKKCSCSAKKLQLTVFNKHVKEDSWIKFKWSPGTALQQRLDVPHRNEIDSALPFFPKEFCLTSFGRPWLPLTTSHSPGMAVMVHHPALLWVFCLGSVAKRPECPHCSLHEGIEMMLNLPAEAQTAACLQHHRAVREAGQLLKQLTHTELRATTATPLQTLGCLISLPNSHNRQLCKHFQNVFRTEGLTRVQQKRSLIVDQGYSVLFGSFPPFPFLFIFPRQLQPLWLVTFIILLFYPIITKPHCLIFIPLSLHSICTIFENNFENWSVLLVQSPFC